MGCYEAQIPGQYKSKNAQLQRLRRDFEMLEMKAGETVIDFLGRVMVIANDMRNAGEDMSDVKIVEKVLRTMTKSFNFVVCTIEESRDLDSITVDELQSSLLIHEQKIRRKVNDEQVLKHSSTQIEEEGVVEEDHKVRTCLNLTSLRLNAINVSLWNFQFENSMKPFAVNYAELRQ
ncbi:hypothetical protein Tco_0810872 [Tanacetum coccineum]